MNRLLDEYLAVFGYLGAARCTLEQLDTKPDFHVLHFAAERRLLHVQPCCRPSEAQAVGGKNRILELANFYQA